MIRKCVIICRLDDFFFQFLTTAVFWDFFGGFLASGKVIFTTDKPECCVTILMDSFDEVLEVLLDDVDDPERIERCESKFDGKLVGEVLSD